MTEPTYQSLDPDTCPVINPTGTLDLLEAAIWTLQKYGTLDKGWEPLRKAVERELAKPYYEVEPETYSFDEVVATIQHPDGGVIEVKPAEKPDNLHTITLRMDITDIAPMIADAAIELGVHDAKQKFAGDDK